MFVYPFQKGSSRRDLLVGIAKSSIINQASIDKDLISTTTIPVEKLSNTQFRIIGVDYTHNFSSVSHQGITVREKILLYQDDNLVSVNIVGTISYSGNTTISLVNTTSDPFNRIKFMFPRIKYISVTEQFLIDLPSPNNIAHYRLNVPFEDVLMNNDYNIERPVGHYYVIIPSSIGHYHEYFSWNESNLPDPNLEIINPTVLGEYDQNIKSDTFTLDSNPNHRIYYYHGQGVDPNTSVPINTSFRSLILT